MRPYKLLLVVLCTIRVCVHAQDSTLGQLPSDYLAKVASRFQSLEAKVDEKSEKALASFQQSEQKMYRKLSRIDSTKAKEYIAASKQKYEQIRQRLSGNQELSQYIPYLDTLKTSLNFLGEHKELLSKGKDVEKKFNETIAKVSQLESSLAKAESVKQFLKERRTALKEQLGGLPFKKELKRLNKQAYYYSAQLQEYKELVKDKKKLERKAMELLSRSKPFQEFMRKNSQLASIFQLPGGGGGNNGTVLQGLQTRAQVNSFIQSRIDAGAPNAQQQIKANIQAAQAQLSELKSKVSQYSNGGLGTSSDLEMPDFKPNQQRTKSFMQRIEVGTNLQSQKAGYFFPATSDLGLSLGYKLHDKSIIGLGMSYKLGLGRGWDDINLSHQGVGLRSFLEFKLKGSLFVSGGYEQNYRTEIRSVDQLKDQSAWQSSGLVGLTKKYKAGKRLKGNVQFLWDFLSYEQVPKTSALLFRVGYTWK